MRQRNFVMGYQYHMPCIRDKRKKREYEYKLDSFKTRQRTDYFQFSCSVDGATTAFSLLESTKKETEPASARDGYGGDDQMTKEEVNNEGVRNVGRMLYQTGWLSFLFRIRTRVRLTYSCTRTASRYPFYSPFRVLFPRTRAHAYSHRAAPEEYMRIWRVGERRKKEERRGKVHVPAAEPVYKVDGGIIVFARPRLKSIPVGIDLWSWDERILTYVLRCRDIFHPHSRLLSLSASIHQPLSGHPGFGQDSCRKKGNFYFYI